jgi:hypothetical protein
MRLQIGILIKKFQAWLPKARAKIYSKAAELETKLNQQDIAQLPQSTLTP